MKGSMWVHFAQLFDTFLNEGELTICEIGTHSGRSAEQFCGHLAEKPNVKFTYYGYDCFELATQDTKFNELNGKGAGRLIVAQNRLNKITSPNFKFKLIKGWTQDTLKEAVFDFVYIDGGHSYETVKHDHEKVEQSKIVCFDDYQIPTVHQYVNEYVEKHNIPKVDWDLEKIKNTDHTVWSMIPYGGRKAKRFVLGKPVSHRQPVIFRK